MDSFISKNGEITYKDALIAEIESLLNTFPTASPTALSRSVMSMLSGEELEHIRDSLLQKKESVIARNKEWLKGFVND